MIKKSPRILVVDDDPSVIAAYRHVLEREPHTNTSHRRCATVALEQELFGEPTPLLEQPDWRVLFVNQGRDAVEAIRASIDASDPFTVAFLDIQMPPGIDGYATARMVRRLDPKLHIVIVSGYSNYTSAELVEVAGPVGRLHFLPKPVWPDQLHYVARTLCDATAGQVGMANPGIDLAATTLS